MLNALWLVYKTCYSPSTKPIHWLHLSHSYFSKPFFQLWFLFWVLTFSFMMSTFVPTDHCDYYLSTPVFPTVILLFSLPSCLARHSPELWRPENNRQAASAVVTNWSDWSNLASCRVDEFQTRQLLSLRHPLGYTSQAVKKKSHININ